MGHENVQSRKLKVQGQRHSLRPFLVVVAAHHPDRGNLLELIKNFPAADIPAVEDAAAVPERFCHFRAQEVMRIGKDADLHIQNHR